MALSYDEIAEIVKIIDASSCDEVIVEAGDVKLVVRRNLAAGAGAGAAPPIAAPGNTAAPARPVPAQPISAAPPSAPAAASNGSAAAPAMVAATNQTAVASPMVGTFYRSPSPDAPPFVEVGQAVRKGDPLCLIEVMKLFTTIASGHDGRIVQIGADNGELVEYGRTLFVIEVT